MAASACRSEGLCSFLHALHNLTSRWESFKRVARALQGRGPMSLFIQTFLHGNSDQDDLECDLVIKGDLSFHALLRSWQISHSDAATTAPSRRESCSGCMYWKVTDQGLTLLHFLCLVDGPQPTLNIISPNNTARGRTKLGNAYATMLWEFESRYFRKDGSLSYNSLC